MRPFLSSTAVALMMACTFGSPVTGHEAPPVDPANLVPIPPYESALTASGAASTEAALAFLNTLSQDERASTLYDFKAPERQKWSNLPAGIVDRYGLRLGDLSPEQLGQVFHFLSAALDQDGYERVASILAAEAYLSTDERAARMQWAPENYWIAFYGTPSPENDWAWSFGGHHLALTLSIKANTVDSMSPAFIGTEPAVFTLDGVPYESVKDMHMAGAALFDALDDAQKARAALPSVPRDIATGPGNDGVVPALEGLPGADMTPQQRGLLLDTIEKWVGVQPDENATARMAEIEAELDAVHFAWIGTAEVNTDAYFRVQGPSLVIEMKSYAGNVGKSADGKGHYHTQYRNLINDYGMGQTGGQK